MKTVLVWIFGILGGVVGLILLLTAAILFLPTKLDLEYRNDRPRLRLRFLFLRFTLFPRKEKKPKRDKKPTPSPVSVPTEAAKDTAAPTEPTKADPLPGTAKKTQVVPPKIPEKKPDAANPSASAVKTALKGFTFRDYVTVLQTVAEEFLAKFRCEKLILHAAIGGEDAMKAAFTYAELHAILYPVCSALASSDKLKQANVQIDPDFTSETIRAEGRAIFSIRLYHSIGCVIALYKKLF